MSFLKDVFKEYLGHILLLITIGGIALFGYKMYTDANTKRLHEELIGTKTKYEQLTKYTAKLESNYQSQKDLQARVEKEWAEINKAKDDRIKLLSDATYLIGKHVEKQNGPDYYFETKKRTRNYLINELRFAGKDSPAIGYIMIKHDGRTYKRNYAFEVQVKSIQTVNESTGRIKVYSKAFLVQKEKSPLKKRKKSYDSWQGKSYELPIVGGVTYIDPTTPSLTSKFQWWAPHLNTGFNLGVDVTGAFLRPMLDFSFSGYGKTKNDLDYKFLHLGFNVDTDFSKPGLHFTPFSYRFFPSVLTNTYVGPAIGWTRDGVNYNVNLNLSL